MMKKYFSIIIIAFFLVVPFAFMHADTATTTPTSLGDKCGTGVDKGIADMFKIQVCDPAALILDVIKYLFALIGLVSTLFIVIGGFRWTVAQGDENAVKGARKTITNAVIGLVIAVLAYTIIGLLVNSLGQGSTTTGGGGGGGNTTAGCDVGNPLIVFRDTTSTSISPISVKQGDNLRIVVSSPNDISSCKTAPSFSVLYAGPANVSNTQYCGATTLTTPCDISVQSSNFDVGLQNQLQVYVDDGTGNKTMVGQLLFVVQ